MRLLVALECENFPEQRRALRAAGLPPPGRLGSTTVVPPALIEAAGGGILLIDPEGGRIPGRIDLPMPSGIAWPDPEGPLWVACQATSRVVVVDPENGKILREIAHPWFNDLHRMAPRPGGGVLVAASGTDAIIALAADGSVDWAWTGRAGIEPERDYAAVPIPTAQRGLHPVSLLGLEDPSEDGVIFTSFHEGTVSRLMVRRATEGATGGLGSRPAFTREILATGLAQPHGLVRGLDGGFWVADTGRGRVLRGRGGLDALSVFAEGFRWLQDLVPTPDGGVYAIENVDFRGSAALQGGPRLLHLDARGAEDLRLELDPDWRLAAMIPLDPGRAARAGVAGGWGAPVRGRWRRGG